MSDVFRLSVESACRIVATGDIDMTTSPEFAAAIPKSGSVWIDFSGVNFVDSTGVGVLIAAYRAARDRGDRLHVSGLRSGPLQVLHMTGLYDLLCD
jgi:anti-sigma B factor antagonist